MSHLHHKILIITAPSGAGKTSITHFLMKTFSVLSFSVSAATRSARDNEKDGVDYYFISMDEFKKKIQQKDFAEWEMVYEGKYYGTLKSELKRIWNLGKIPVLDIDVKGALHVQQQYPENTLSIFVEPPSVDELKKRLLSRGTESEDSLNARVNKASYEIAFKDHFDEIIVNDNLESACIKAKEIVASFLNTYIMDWIALLAIFVSLIFIGFLSGIEIAFISANKLSIELKKKQGTISGKTWGQFSDNPTRFIGTILVGVNILLVIYGLLIGDMLSPVWEWIKKLLPKSASDYVDYIRLLVETVLSTTIILFTEFICKAFFRARSNAILNSDIISNITRFFYWLLSSVSTLYVNMSEWMLKYIFNVKISNKKEAFTKIDLEHFLQQNKHSDDDDSDNHINKELFENALSLSDIKLRECLIPRKEIEGIEFKTTIANARAKFIETKLSKIIVYDNNIDNIVGYVHHLDLFKNPGSLKDVIHPIPTVPETMNASDMINKFSKERKSIAWVVDEFGGTAGIVTMEDLLEELFGEIEDEHDVPETFVDKQIAQNEYVFSGRLELDFISQKYQISFEGNEEAETLSGYIIQNHEAIPKQKERIIIGHLEFDILNVSDTRIETVKIKVLK